MEEEKEYYKDLYRKYKDLRERTTLKVSDLSSTGKIEIQNFSAEDLKNRLDVEEKLTSGLSYLSDDQLIELSGDDFFSEKASDILKKRKMLE